MKKEKTSEISKTTITTLLIIAILVSIIGTWTVLNTMDNVIKGAALRPIPVSSSGQVALTIGEPVESTGKVEVTILPTS